MIFKNSVIFLILNAILCASSLAGTVSSGGEPPTPLLVSQQDITEIMKSLTDPMFSTEAIKLTDASDSIYTVYLTSPQGQSCTNVYKITRTPVTGPNYTPGSIEISAVLQSSSCPSQ